MISDDLNTVALRLIELASRGELTTDAAYGIARDLAELRRRVAALEGRQPDGNPRLSDDQRVVDFTQRRRVTRPMPTENSGG